MAENPLQNKDFLQGDGKPFQPIIDNIIQLQNEISKLKDGMKTAGVELSKVRNDNISGAKQQAVIVDEVTKKQELLTKAESEQAKEIAKLNVAIGEQNRKNKEAAKEAGATGSAYDAQSAKLNNLRKQYKDLAVQNKENTKEGKLMLRNITDLDKKLKDVDKSVGQNQRSVGGYGKALKGFAMQFVGALGITGLVVGFTNAMKNVIKNTAEFQKTLKTLQSVIGGTKEEMDGIAQVAKDVGTRFGKGAVEVAKMQVELGKMGFTAKEIENTTEAIVALSIATGEDLGKSGEIVSNVLRQFNLSTTESTRITDVMTKSFNDSALGLDNFGEAMRYAGPIAKSAGFTFEETAAMLGVLSDAGVKGSNAGTSLRFIFTELAAKGGDVREEFKKMATNGMSVSGALDETGRNAMTALNILGNNQDKLVKFTENMENAAGATLKTADAVGDTMLGAWDRFTSRLSNSLILEGASTFFKNLLNMASNAMKGIDEIKKGVADSRLQQFLQYNAKTKDRVADINAEIQATRSLNNEKKKEIESLKAKAFQEKAAGMSQSDHIKALEQGGEKIKMLEEQIKSNITYMNALGGVRAELTATKPIIEEVVEAKKEDIVNTEKLAKANENAAKKIKEAYDRIAKDIAAGQKRIEESEQEHLDRIDKMRDDAQARDDERIDEYFKQVNDAMTDKYKILEETGQLSNEMRLDIELDTLKESLGFQYLTKEQQEIAITSLQEKYADERIAKTQEEYAEKLKVAEQYASATMDVMDTISNFNEARMNRELQAAGDDEAKKEAIKKEYAKKDQDMAVGKALINGALAVGNALLTTPFVPIGLIMAGVAAARTASEVALIRSVKFAKGGFVELDGASHDNGGVPLAGIGEAEGKEGVSIWRKSVMSKHKSSIEGITNAINSGDTSIFNNDNRFFGQFSELTAIAKQQYSEQRKTNEYLSKNMIKIGEKTYKDMNGNKIHYC